MLSPSISFIVPAYNVENYIDECILSIIKAAEDGDEIIVINDGSTDGTHEICRAWAQAYPNLFIYVSQNNGGLSAARNAGFEKSKCDYILFMDSDDVLNHESLRIARNVLMEKKPEILVMEFLWWRSENNVIKSPPKYSHEPNNLIIDRLTFCQETFKDSLLSACSRIFKRNLLEKFAPAIFQLGRFYEEIHAVPRITLQANSFYYLPMPLFLYRLRVGSITQKKTPERCRDLATALGQTITEVKKLDADSSNVLEISANMAAAIYIIKAVKESSLVERPSLSLTRDLLRYIYDILSIPMPEIIDLLEKSGWRDSMRTSRHLKIAAKSELVYIASRVMLNKWRNLVEMARKYKSNMTFVVK